MTLYQSEVQRVLEKSWVKVVYLTQIVRGVHQFRQMIQRVRMQQCYYNQMTSFIQRKFLQKMLTLGPTLDLRSIGQVR